MRSNHVIILCKLVVSRHELYKSNQYIFITAPSRWLWLIVFINQIMIIANYIWGFKEESFVCVCLEQIMSIKYRKVIKYSKKVSFSTELRVCWKFCVDMKIHKNTSMVRVEGSCVISYVADISSLNPCTLSTLYMVIKLK